MEDGGSSGLRRALDDGAGDIGESAGTDLPETLVEVRAELPDSVDAVLDGSHSNDDLSLGTVLDGTPLDGVLNAGAEDVECETDD